MAAASPFRATIRATRFLACSALAICATVLVAAAPAGASTIIDRNASAVTLQVNAAGEAQISYRAQGKQMRVLASGAVDALAPTRSRPQVAFKLDYSGGYQSHYVANPAAKANLSKLRDLQQQMARATADGNNQLRFAIAPKIAAVYRTLASLRKAATSFSNVCRPYTGPELPWLLVACTAPDGSHWALQSWQRMLPNLGLTPWLASQSVWELRLSHWTEALPVLEIQLDWVNTQKAQHLFGRLSYLDQPVFGFGSEANGNPTDTYGRNIYLDVFNAPNYGTGWKRENSFLTHNPGGNFCYGFYPHSPYPGYPSGERPAGHGERYRATVIGPGVLPDVGWQGVGIGAFNANDASQASYEQKMNDLSDSFGAGDSLCRQH